MANFDASARLFDRCSALNPIRSEYDLDDNQQYILLGSLKHDYRSAHLPEFVLSKDSPFRFQGEGIVSHRVSAQAGASVMLCVDIAHLQSLPHGNPVLLKETVRLFRVSEEAVTAVVHVTLRLFRSGPPRPAVQINLENFLQLAGEIPADGYVQFGTILLDPPESATVEHRAQADFVARAELLGESGNALPLSVKRYCLDDDEKDRGWLTAGEEFVEPLELKTLESRWRTNRFDLGVPYRELRSWMRAAMPLASGHPLFLRANVLTFLRGERGLLELLEEVRQNIEIEGQLSDSISFSGLCGMTPRRLPVTTGTTRGHNFNFPSIRARLDDRKPAVTEAVELHVEAHDQELEIEISAVLDGGARLLSYDFPMSVVGVERKSFAIPAKHLLEQARKANFDMDTLRLCVTATVKNSQLLEPVEFSFEGNFAFERKPPEWLACIDFGTSSTALWIGTGTQAVGHPVGLGSWLSRIDRYHSESFAQGATDDGVDGAVSRGSFLLPSHIGLSSDFNLRADFDPLSLGNLALAYPGREAALQRLEALDRSYDISVPFPSTIQMPDYVSTIITEPKRRMVLRAAHVPVEGGVVKRGEPHPVQVADLAKVIDDYFHELGSYTAPSALSHDAASSSGAILKDIEKARLDSNTRFGAVVTHPCGIDDARREIYRSAGRRFLQGFCGSARSKSDDVILIPEALAAARYGIEETFQEELRASQSTRDRETFLTLDIGAGTYDVTAIETDSPNANRWRVASHFGLAVGGADLDAAIVKRILSLLGRARTSRSISDAFDIRVDIERSEPRHQQWLEIEFQAAKARLTAQLLAAASYTWAASTEGGPTLDIVVGRPDGGSSLMPGDGLVVARGAAEIERPIPGIDGKLVCTRTARGLVVMLCVGPDVFSARPTPDSLDVLMDVIGSELPATALKGAIDVGRPIVVVTGRAALWPPLYQRIEQIVKEHHTFGARMSRHKPFRPDQMKQAVVLGAITLAREAPGRNLEAQIENPIALINFKIDLQASSGAGAGRVARKVTLLIDDNYVTDKPSRKTVVIDGPFVIARIMPGLERVEGQAKRLNLFQSLYGITRIKPYVELTHELAHPLPGRRDGPVEWEISWHRDVSGIRLTFDCGVSPPIEFGPFGGGRMYVPD